MGSSNEIYVKILLGDRILIDKFIGNIKKMCTVNSLSVQGNIIEDFKGLS